MNNITQQKHSLTGGPMATPVNNTTLTLRAYDDHVNYVTWIDGKRQIRAALKSIGWTAVGLFRARKENKNEFSIMARDKHGNLHHIRCARKPGAIIEKTLLTA